MNTKYKELLVLASAFALVGSLFFAIFIVFQKVWGLFISLDKQLSVALLTAFTTVVVATITVMLGRHFERRKDAESHFRANKIEIYDEFLLKFFELFHDRDRDTDELVDFLRDWQRKMILWGGAPVLSSYIEWNKKLQSDRPDAKSVFLMDKLFRAMRKDVGLSNSGLEKGVFAHFVLRHSALFLQLAKENPNISLDEIAQRENEIERHNG